MVVHFSLRNCVGVSPFPIPGDIRINGKDMPFCLQILYQFFSQRPERKPVFGLKHLALALKAGLADGILATRAMCERVAATATAVFLKGRTAKFTIISFSALAASHQLPSLDRTDCLMDKKLLNKIMARAIRVIHYPLKIPAKRHVQDPVAIYLFADPRTSRIDQIDSDNSLHRRQDQSVAPMHDGEFRGSPGVFNICPVFGTGIGKRQCS